MTDAQEARLRTLCTNYGVVYDPTSYKPTFDLPSDWVAGWVGPIYVGVDPDGHAHS